MNFLLGREKEWSKLHEIIKRKTASFVAIYGRRRIGKKYLVENFCAKLNAVFISITGLKNGSLRDQLDIFQKGLENLFTKGLTFLLLPMALN